MNAPLRESVLFRFTSFAFLFLAEFVHERNRELVNDLLRQIIGTFFILLFLFAAAHAWEMANDE